VVHRPHTITDLDNFLLPFKPATPANVDTDNIRTRHRFSSNDNDVSWAKTQPDTRVDVGISNEDRTAEYRPATATNVGAARADSALRCFVLVCAQQPFDENKPSSKNRTSRIVDEMHVRLTEVISTSASAIVARANPESNMSSGSASRSPRGRSTMQMHGRRLVWTIRTNDDGVRQTIKRIVYSNE